MSSYAGKTAPRLVQDLLTYDVRFEGRAGRNLLTSAPPHFDPSSPPTAAVPTRNCRHKLTLKREQSSLADSNDASFSPVSKVASFCQSCRYHVNVLVDLRQRGSKTVPCRQSSGEYSLHHFIFESEETETTHNLGFQNGPRLFKFRCSAPLCSADLRIRIRPPRLSEQQITTLTNRAVLRKRLEDAKAHGGDRADAQMARSVDALDFLSTYLSDALNPQKGKSRIPLLNRKFLKTFGRDCDDILTFLGFTHEIEAQEDGSPGAEVWHLPRPPPAADPLGADTQRTVIEDVQHELSALILKWPESERTGVRHPLTQPQPAVKFLEQILGCENYQRKPLSGTRSANSEEDHPYYAGLGAVGDFSDALLLFAYTCQVRADPANAAYYFECLQDIAIGRKSNLLETQVQILASEGQANRQEVVEAYRYLGMDPKHAHVLSDEHIVGQFRARLQDIGPAAIEETRNRLRIIGHARNSDKIKQEASNAIETYSQAMSWLDLEEGHADDFVVTMYSVKVNENESNQDIARRAVEIIADHRNSQALRDWLISGTLTGSGEMDVGEAYALLDIKDRTGPIDLTMLDITVQSFASDNPGSKAKYEKAYELIKKDQESNQHGLQNGNYQSRKKYPLGSWPVGCLNIGNTCYLNSVLQFLFTIKPLRNVVLDCENHFEERTVEALQSKRVGRSAVTAEKVEKAQQFVQELRALFLRMIHANTDCIRPETRLAALALAKNDITAITYTQTPTENGRLGEIGGLTVAGPMLPPPTAHESVGSAKDSVMEDDASSKPEALSSITEVDADNDHTMHSVPSGPLEIEIANKPEPPSRPPPIPPRPQDMKKIEGLAEQQDAAEILNNVFDLLSCAFKGLGTLRDGEQDDFIKKLFFSDVTSVRMTNDKIANNSALQDNHLISPGNRDRPLYAALDDEFSLTELESETSQDNAAKTFKYEYISTASPIHIVNVRRLVFEGGKSKKDESHLGLDEVLYLDRYLEQTKSLSKAQLQALRDKQWQLQRKLRQKESRKAELQQTDLKLSLPDAVDEAAEFIEASKKAAEETLIDLDDNAIPTYTNLHGQMKERANDLRKETETLDEQMKELDEQIESIFKDCKDHPYRLHAVFMHRGSAGGGHYWIYIYDFQNKIWRDYNDERVEEAEVKKVFEQDGKATSTGIVFVQADRAEELTEAVHRQPDPAPGQEIEMKDLDSSVPITDVQVIEGIEKE